MKSQIKFFFFVGQHHRLQEINSSSQRYVSLNYWMVRTKSHDKVSCNLHFGPFQKQTETKQRFRAMSELTVSEVAAVHHKRRVCCSPSCLDMPPSFITASIYVHWHQPRIDGSKQSSRKHATHKQHMCSEIGYNTKSKTTAEKKMPSRQSGRSQQV